MKKYAAVIIILLLCCTSACGNKDLSSKPETDITDSTSDDKTVSSEQQKTIDATNRAILAEKLGIEEDSKKIQILISSLNAINAGQIQEAEVTEIDGEEVINLTVEDNRSYQVYFTNSGSVEAIKDCLTNEWPIRSVR